MISRRGPVPGQLPGFAVDPGMAGQHNAGPGGVPHEAGGVRAEEDPQPPAGRAVPVTGGEHLPRGFISVQMPGVPGPGGDRFFQRGQQHPSGRASPRQRRRGDLRSLPSQPGHQRVLATPGNEPLRQQPRDEPVADQTLTDRLRRPRRPHRFRPLTPTATLIAATPVHQHPNQNLPVDLLDDMIA
jgi:hypothetical protein